VQPEVSGMQAVKGLLMEKWLCWGSIATGGILFLLFVLNLFAGVPFGRGIGWYVDVAVILASGVVMYLGWNALREIL
jgi:hypothetical protein